jgi:hypothetical protein
MLHKILDKVLGYAYGTAFQKNIFEAIAGGLASGVAGSLLGGGDSGGGAAMPVRAAEFRSNNGLFNTSMDTRPGQDLLVAEATGPLAGVQSGQVGYADNYFNQAQSDPNAQLAGSMGYDFLSGMGNFDPMQIAQMQYEQFQPIMQGQFDQANLDMEGRQFAQGRLGSTGGANDFNALYDSQNDSNRALLFDSFGQGLNAQNQQYNIGSGLMSLDQQLQQGLFGMGSSALNNALGINTSALDTFRTLSGAQGGGGSSAGSGGYSPMQTVGQGLLNSGVNQISGAVGGLFQPSGVTNSPYTNNTINGYTSTTAGR